MIDEGYIKFSLDWEKTKPLEVPSQLISWRNRLRRANLIGVYEAEAIGFGNISIRRENSAYFTISGSATGDVWEADASHFSEVTGFSIEENRVQCRGAVPASSESLTHAMIYACDPKIQAVLHVHHAGMWNQWMHQAATTAKEVPYGTPEMAGEIRRLFAEGAFAKDRFMVMAGHEEGVISFGETLVDAARTLSTYFDQPL